MRLTLFAVLSLLFSSQAFGALPMWHCELKSELTGNNDSVYAEGRDTFLGTENFTCVKYPEDLEHQTIETYEVRLEGILKTGFISVDKISLSLSTSNDGLPNSFEQTFSELNSFNDVLFGDKVTLVMSAKPEDKSQQRALLEITTPASIANDVKYFLNNAKLIITKKSDPLPDNNYIALK